MSDAMIMSLTSKTYSNDKRHNEDSTSSRLSDILHSAHIYFTLNHWAY